MSWLARALGGGASLTNTLSQSMTNGASTLGLIDAEPLPRFLSDNILNPNPPWEFLSATGPPPDTGVIRDYDLSVSRSIIAPDGYNKSVILINGQFPGPLLEANWGDTIRVNVANKIDNMKEPLTLHWHGQLQRLNPWYDGIPAITQCPIPPGGKFTYTFRAENFGTSWYHSHVSGQYGDGLFGPLIIYGPETNDYDYDLGPVILSDYNHIGYFQTIIEGYAIPSVLPDFENNLINGKGIYDCSNVNSSDCTSGAGLAKFRFRTGKKHRLRLINSGTETIQRFTIDNHRMTIIANDYVPVEPYTVDVVTLNIGQRTDIIVEADGEATDAVWMRADLDMECSELNITNSHGLAAIYYSDASEDIIPNTTAGNWSRGNCGNDPLEQTVPLYPRPLPNVPRVVETVNITLTVNETGQGEFQMNGTSYKGNYNEPLLLLAQEGNVSYPNHPEWNVWNFGRNESIRLILKNYWIESHPIHLHGHDSWILAEGVGDWDGQITRPENPQRRDTHTILGGTTETPGYLVIEFETDNPGVWPLHCHKSIHQSGGMLINIFERPDLLVDRDVPQNARDLCAQWDQWSKVNVVPQIDSGIK